MSNEEERKDRGCDHSCSCSNSGEDSYWQDVHQKDIDTEVLKQEFSKGEFDSFSVVKNRRDFLKVMGFSFTILPLAACTKSTVRKAVPYLEKNDVIIPGVPSWFATSYDGVPLLIKTREGRPIKVEGNDKSLWTRGGASAISQASILSLYDSYRLKYPKKNNAQISWNVFENNLVTAFDKAKKEGRKIALITEECRSPSKVMLIDELKKQYPTMEQYIYAPISNNFVSKSLESDNSEIFYSIEEADFILGVSADLLGADRNSISYSRQYANKKSVDNRKIPLRHVQIESVLSLTGSNADERYPLDVDEIKTFMLLLLAKVGGEDAHLQASKDLVQLANKIGNELLAHKGRSIVANGLPNLEVQVITNKINVLLGNFEKTVHAVTSDSFKLSNEEKFEGLVDSLIHNRSDIDVVVFWDVNPFYSYYDLAKIKSAFARVNDKFALVFSEDETSFNCFNVAPIHHQYESWGDAISGADELVVSQPVISPLYETKQAEDIFLKILGKNISHDDYMKEVWSKKFMKGQTKHLTITSFWTEAVHDGVVVLPKLVNEISVKNRGIDNEVRSLVKSIDINNDDTTLVLYSKIGLGDGKYANNPWLQELPDPITKATWDNYLLISPVFATAKGLTTGDVVDFSLNGKSVEISILVQPGLAKRTVGMAVGYGRKVSGKVGKDLGLNAYQFSNYKNGHNEWSISNPVITKTGKKYELALTQTHHSLEGRDIIKETTFGAFKSNPASGNEGKHHVVSMWGTGEKTGHQWAMAIDLNKCNGCSACVVSCNAENNVPVVGRDEVRNRREMHWMRIDRYYKGNDNSPTVAYQPMTCQHCENAPCESVCPVLATVHSSDGLNQQVYNRCVGTRYCANNCPYKVRRFNWFDYPHTDPNENMVLNPDVAVRSRGVMEKCSMCIQRIQESKLNAKKEGRELRDGEIKLACQQSCPSDAIVFGDMNDKNSKIFQILKDPRNFTVLEELNVKPRVSYLTKIRNKE